MSLTARAAALVADRRSGPTAQSLAIILKAIDTHVATAAAIGERDCIAPVPLFIPQATQFNIDQNMLVAKLVQHYTQKGFHARELGPFRIYISWRYPRRATTRAKKPKRAPA